MTQSVEAPPKPFREGLHFEDFELGQVLWSSRRTVTEGEIAVFAGLSGDYTALHVDEEFAKKSPFRGRIAHGMLVWSIA
ncbi:MAG: MaoC/PaaZ C-terminal domain-containing protein, partial [Planctomycetota bacterium]|nr:MaoC/PaaZ C-terminal domain-containing protein [Planctomycetota bacterium]